MAHTNLTFTRTETVDEIGQRTAFDAYDWGVVVIVEETADGRQASCSMLLERSEIEKLHAFLGTYLGR